MTKKIYEKDPYIRECQATIEEIKMINGETWICFDQTIFYPEGGGQPADDGYVDDIPVYDVQIFDGVIYHKVAEPIDKSRVKLSVNYERRFDHMQQHSGQHLLSAVWEELYNIKTVSFHLGKDVCTIDLQTNHLNEDQINEVETKIAQYIFENRTVETYVLPYDEVESERIIKLKETPLFVRFVDIEGIDSSTCCGTHVSMLGEIGILKIIGTEKYKELIRLHFVCGKRAFTYFQQVAKASNEMGAKLNVPASKVSIRFAEFYEGHQALKKQYQKLYEKEIHHEAKQIIEKTESDIVEVKWPDRSLQEMKDLAKIIIESENKIVILCSVDQNTWIFASSSSQLFNVSNCIKVLKERYGGKGGGNPVFGQWIGEVDDESWLCLKKELLM